ncbi:MAG: N-acetyl-gamma-glutamyl-phosphate reductase [Actinobacteria bacterium]|nr:N-acetyl-gamma-glutamyl-phosphate reductase [Actinomycetota bacterium]
MLKVGIVGASGYTGTELIRILVRYPKVEIKLVTANQLSGQEASSVYPSLKGFFDGKYETYDPDRVKEECDVVFLGLPHQESMAVVKELAPAGIKIVDLSADFRFDDRAMYEKTYGVVHLCPELLEDAVYGLPEINREMIKGSKIVANPGCYPTAALLGLYPAASAGLIDGGVVIDAKSGVSGAGRKLTLESHFSTVADGISPYAVSGHRHGPEIKQELTKLAGDVGMVFVPHLVPMNRGILCTMYVKIGRNVNEESIRGLYRDAYSKEHFVQLLESGTYPRTKALQGWNGCHVAVELKDGETLVIMTAIDNLVKGASGQAVQNMNLMCGFPEEKALAGPGLFP